MEKGFVTKHIGKQKAKVYRESPRCEPIAHSASQTYLIKEPLFPFGVHPKGQQNFSLENQTTAIIKKTFEGKSYSSGTPNGYKPLVFN